MNHTFSQRFFTMFSEGYMMTITTKELTQPKLKKAGLISFLLFLVCLFVCFFFFFCFAFCKNSYDFEIREISKAHDLKGKSELWNVVREHPVYPI